MKDQQQKLCPRSFGFGDRAIFQCRVDLSPEMDDAYARPEEAASWGSLELWAGGRNLTAHYESGELMSSVSWYLMATFEWLSEHWDFLFHEQRPPTAFEGDNAWASLDQTRNPDYFERFGVNADKIAEENYEWSRRHCLWSASDGGIFPDIVIRRDRDDIEISWGGSGPTGTPDHVFFANGPGAVRVPPKAVAEVFYEILRVASTALGESLPESERILALLRSVGKLAKRQRRDQRMAILAGLGANFIQWRKHWGHLKTKVLKNYTSLADWFEGDVEDTLVITGNCNGALMFGSAAPTLRERDVFALAENLVEHSRVALKKDKLEEHAMAKPLNDIPFKDGYRLAVEWAEASNLWHEIPELVNIERHLSGFGVTVSDITLSDEDIGGIAVARSGLAPIILVNTANPRNAYPSGRRFTLAHELCHLLYDRDRAHNVALISGPWASPSIEKRANAFAAALLMPGALIDAAFESQRGKAHNPSYNDLLIVAQKLEVSVDALAHHMSNLGYFSPAHRDRLLYTLPTTAELSK